jgi:hypothetical protein
MQYYKVILSIWGRDKKDHFFCEYIKAESEKQAEEFAKRLYAGSLAVVESVKPHNVCK